jgi:hypothetical protein
MTIFCTFQYTHTQNPETFTVTTKCDMHVCKVHGKTLGINDEPYTTLVYCEGVGPCTNKLHPVCTVTPVLCAHSYCCHAKLHDFTGRNRLYLCDSCVSGLVCKKAFKTETRGRWV